MPSAWPLGVPSRSWAQPVGHGVAAGILGCGQLGVLGLNPSCVVFSQVGAVTVIAARIVARTARSGAIDPSTNRANSRRGI
jgi:hypothetical protein